MSDRIKEIEERYAGSHEYSDIRYLLDEVKRQEERADDFAIAMEDALQWNRDLRAANEKLEAVRAAAKAFSDSMCPHPEHHPSMYKAKQALLIALKDAEQE